MSRQNIYVNAETQRKIDELKQYYIYDPVRLNLAALFRKVVDAEHERVFGWQAK